MKIEEPLEKFKNEAKKCVVIEETDNITATVEVVSFALDHDACANNDGEDIHDTYLIRFYELQQCRLAHRKRNCGPDRFCRTTIIL